MGSEDTWRKPIISSDLSMFDCMVDKMSFPVRERVVSEMFPSSFSNSTSMSEEASGSSVLNPMFPSSSPHQEKIKKRRNHPGNPAPDSEVIALSPKTLMATNRFICEVCHKGFQRDQNLQLHRRGHSLPWKLKQRDPKDFKKKVYVCPEPTCIHHNPSRALGDLTGIKKHFSRKHGEKKWKCEKCSKCYAVLSDHKAHIKTCGTKEYKCDCGTIFSRKDSFTTHRAFCEALAEESAKLTTTTTNPLLQTTPTNPSLHLNHQNPNLTHLFSFPSNTTQLPRKPSFPSWNPPPPQNPNPSSNNTLPMMKPQFHHNHNHNQIPTISSSPLLTSLFHQNPNMTNNYHVNNNNNTNTSHQLLSATAMLQAANVAAAPLPFGGTTTPSQSVGHHMTSSSSSLTQLEMAAGLNAFGNSVSHHHQIGNNRMPSQQQQQQQQQQEEYMGLNAENLATWQESGHATRDFLGLAGGDCSTNAGNVNVSNLFSFAGTVDLPSYNRVQSLLKSRGFRY